MTAPGRPVRLLIFEETYEAVRAGLLTQPATPPAPSRPQTGRHHWRDDPTGRTRMGDHSDENGDGIADHGDEPAAMTAGQDDHSDPWVFAGEDVAAPTAGEEPGDGVA